MIKLEKKYLELLELYLCVCTRKRKGGRGSDRAGMKRGSGRGGKRGEKADRERERGEVDREGKERDGKGNALS
jgi:hypothetical protein